MFLFKAYAQRTVCAFIFLVLAGCSDESLYSGLSEQEANEMVATLSLAGLDASKQKLKGNEFSVSTSPDNFAQAVQLLKNHGLPRQRYDTLGEVFAKEGFVSSPLEERARLNHALSQEIASTLSSIDGVVLARVHLAVPPKNDLDDTTAAASASVFVKHRSDVDLSGSVTRIKALVVNGLENMPYENVTVALFEAKGSALVPTPDATLMPVKAAAQQMSIVPQALFRGNAAGMIALLAMLIAVLFALIRVRQSKQS